MSSNIVSKFHEDPTVNDSTILVLMSRFGCMREKKKAQCKGHFSHHRHYFTNSNDERVWNWVVNLVIKFHNDPMVNESMIVVLLRYVWVYARKRKGFKRGRRENEFERKRE